MHARLSAARGQTLVETALFMPLLLFTVLAIYYMAQFGVIAERVQSAVRYGSQIVYPANVYKFDDLYVWLDNPLHPSPSLDQAGCLQTEPEMVNALYQHETLGGVVPLPSTQPYWQPNSVPPAGVVCTPSTRTLNNTHPSGQTASGNPYVAFDYATVTAISLQATVAIPTYLQALHLPSVTTGEMGGIHANPPHSIMYCSPYVAGPVALALGASSSQPYGNYVAPSGNPHNC